MKVSVLITAFRFEDYISKCLDSVIEQKTTFPFEILVGVEEGDIPTIQICEEYQKKFPSLIQVHVNPSENVIYAYGKRTGRANFFNILNRAKGQYVARLDGDDYWTNNNKLEKQVQAFEGNPNLAIVHHRALIDYGYKQIETHKNRKIKVLSNLDDMLNRTPVFMCTVLFKRESLPNPLPRWVEKISCFDWPMFTLLMINGDMLFLEDTMATYRKMEQGITNKSKGQNRLKRDIDTYTYLETLIPKANKKALRTQKARIYFNVITELFRSGEAREALVVYNQARKELRFSIFLLGVFKGLQGYWSILMDKILSKK